VKERRGDDETKQYVAVADTTLAKRHLGFSALVPLSTGLIQTIAWHYDRGHPYFEPPSNKYKNAFIASHGSISCNPYDKDCLRGAAVFPCASECAKQSLCIPTPYDEVIPLTAQITKSCDTVFYTLELDPKADVIPLTKFSVMPMKTAFLPKQCQIAFVSSDSPLATTTTTHWTIVPVPSAPHFPQNYLHLPKFTPGFFFPHSTEAVYASPSTLFTNLPSLLEDFRSPHPHISNSLITLMTSFQKRTYTKTLTPETRLQERAYDTMFISFLGELPSSRRVNTDWLFHRLQNSDGRMLRCDVYNEILSWNVPDMTRALPFVVGLHSLWTRVIYSERRLESEEEEEEEGWEKEEAFNGDLKPREVETVMEVEKKLEGEWLGILASGKERLFVRILEEGTGDVVSLGDYGL